PDPPLGNTLFVFLNVDAESLTATGAWSVVMMTSCSCGVVVGSEVARSASYCTYCAFAIAAGNAPGAGTVTNELHVAPGVGVLPVRTFSATDVPAGVRLVH